MAPKIEFRLSPKTIYTLILIAVVILLIWKLSVIIILTITALMCAAALDPLVVWLNKKLRLNLNIAAALVIIGLVLPLIYVLISVIPTFAAQLPGIMNEVSHSLNSYSFIPSEIRNINLAQYFQNNISYILSSTSLITDFFFQTITLVFMIFYLLVDGERLHSIISSLIPAQDRKKIEKIFSELARISGLYIRGNLLISFICMVVIFSGLLIMKVPFALPLAIFAGIFDLLPLIGSTIGAIPAVIIGFSISPLAGLLVVILFIAYQMFENNIISPLIYKQVLDLIPFLSFIAVIIGTILFGIPGAFLALPIAAGIPTILKYLKTR
ncbi:MAG: AI-2E family transporter [Patescibacteria group bacterium]